MKLPVLVFLALLQLLCLSFSTAEEDTLSETPPRNLKGKKSSKSSSGKKGSKETTEYEDDEDDKENNGDGSDTGHMKEIDIVITNLSYQQPFGNFFVMVHNENVDPLFVLGEQASPGLRDLAENGDTSKLVDLYDGHDGVLIAGTIDGPVDGGATIYFTLPVNDDYPYVTLASMALNTNDCFVALNGGLVAPGEVISAPGYDAGTEENNEDCESIPGPACAANSGNEAPGNGEGYVHVHRGFFGVGGQLSQQGYAWLNPMIRIEIHEADY